MAGEVSVQGVKSCFRCGENVMGRKRVKDSSGRYYCEKCYDIAVEEQRKNRGAVAPQSVGPAKGSANSQHSLVPTIASAAKPRALPQQTASKDNSLRPVIVAARVVFGVAIVTFGIVVSQDKPAPKKESPPETEAEHEFRLNAIAERKAHDKAVEEEKERQAAVEKERQDAQVQRWIHEANSQKDKADYMRDHGFNSGTDADLAATYDRIKTLDDAKAARDQRLGR